YSLSFWMHSDALFCLISTAAMLLACQINERRRLIWWRIGALILLCIVATLVRVAGVLQCLIIVGLLLGGWSWRHRFSRQWNPQVIAALLALGVTAGTFLVVRKALEV